MFYGHLPAEGDHMLLRAVASLLLCCSSFAMPLWADETRAATQPSTTPDKPLAIFQRICGTWRGQAHWSNGEELRTRVKYEYGVGEHVVKVSSFVVKQQTSEATLVYETFIWRHPRDKRLRFISISNGGALYEGTVNGTRDALNFQWSAYLQDRKTEYKQALTMKGDDAYQWTVWQQSPAGDWKQIINAVLTREPTAAVSATIAR
jgi:hypothetical protein